MLTILALATAVPLLSGCSGMTSTPTGPAADAAARSPAPAGPTKAVVEISRLGVYPHPSGSLVWWDTSFRLREAGGLSGVVVKQVTVYAEGPVILGVSPTASVDEECWRKEIRVEPGGIQDAFFWGPERDSLAHCAPGLQGSVAISSITIVVTFVDDQGVRGSAAATLQMAE